MDYQQTAYDAAVSVGVDPALFMGLIQSESGWDQTQVNPKTGAIGLGQVLPSTAADPGYGISRFDPSQPDSNLYGSAALFNNYLNMYDGDTAQAIASYKGYSDPSSNNALDDITKVMDYAKNYKNFLSSGDTGNKTGTAGGASGSWADSGGTEKKTETSGPWWSSFGNVVSSLKSITLGFTIGFIGLIILIATVYAVINKEARQQIISVVKGSAE